MSATAPTELPARAYWTIRAGQGELRQERVVAEPPIGRSLVRAEHGGVSTGTERLVGRGLVPPECHAPMACRGMAGTFDLPIKYGYCLIGTGIAGALQGQRVFVMHPHQELAVIADEHALPLPPALPGPRAALIPNLETAVNAVWDAELGEAERPLVVGGGGVGLLVAYALQRLHRSAAPVVERDPQRAAAAAAHPWVPEVLQPPDVAQGAFTVAFHTTGSGAGLQLALDAVGFEGRVVDLSWYGAQRVTLQLGTSYHFHRKRLLASQVGAVATSKRAALGPRERLNTVLSLLDAPALDALLGAPVPFDELPSFMAQLYDGDAAATAAVPTIAYRARPLPSTAEPSRSEESTSQDSPAAPDRTDPQR
ncbi:MAG: dehydrogenase [Planctomycetota bacterium]